MHPFKIKKLAAVNDAMNAIYLQKKRFELSLKPDAVHAYSKLQGYILGGCRQIDCFIEWDNVHGFTFTISARHGFNGLAQEYFTYLPIHADINRLFNQAFEMAQLNSDRAYSRAERSFTGY